MHRVIKMGATKALPSFPSSRRRIKGGPQWRLSPSLLRPLPDSNQIHRAQDQGEASWASVSPVPQTRRRRGEDMCWRMSAISPPARSQNSQLSTTTPGFLVHVPNPCGRFAKGPWLFSGETPTDLSRRRKVHVGLASQCAVSGKCAVGSVCTSGLGSPKATL